MSIRLRITRRRLKIMIRNKRLQENSISTDKNWRLDNDKTKEYSFIKYTFNF